MYCTCSDFWYNRLWCGVRAGWLVGGPVSGANRTIVRFCVECIYGRRVENKTLVDLVAFDIK